MIDDCLGKSDNTERSRGVVCDAADCVVDVALLALVSPQPLTTGLKKKKSLVVPVEFRDVKVV